MILSESSLFFEVTVCIQRMSLNQNCRLTAFVKFFVLHLECDFERVKSTFKSHCVYKAQKTSKTNAVRQQSTPFEVEYFYQAMRHLEWDFHCVKSMCKSLCAKHGQQ